MSSAFKGLRQSITVEIKNVSIDELWNKRADGNPFM